MPSFNSIYTIILFTVSSFQLITSLSFNFTNFNPNIHELIYYSDASPSDLAIQLTSNQNDKDMNGSSGRVTFIDPMHLWDNPTQTLADFTTHFSFIIKSQNGSHNYGDGLTFFLAPVNFPMPPVQEGSGIGLVGGDQILNSTLNPFVAIEFDTYPNKWDMNTEHVGINVNSMVSVKNVSWWADIPSGKLNEAWVSYDSSTKNLSVVFTGFIYEDEMFLQSLCAKIDLRKYLPEWVSFGFSAATGDSFEIHTLHTWEFNSSLNIVKNVSDLVSSISPSPVISPSPAIQAVPPPTQKRKKNRLGVFGMAIGGSIFGLILISLLVFVLYGYKRKVIKKLDARDEKDEKELFDFSSEFENETGPKKFSYKELAIATKGFKEDEKVGEGGFGGVYKGYLMKLNSFVAVKRVSRESKQGIKEYASEVRTISRLGHRNLVKLIGWCHEEKELLLVYEFMPNGSLDYHLFKENNFLTWAMRYNIAKGLATAILYLHEEWEQCVLHRDIKSSNIMLDTSFNAKLGDFGLARLVDHDKGVQTTLLAGTLGYMAPECVMTGKASKGSDVYSFGIVALELASGLRPIHFKGFEGQVRLVDHVWDLYGQGKLVEGADRRLGVDFDEKQMERLMIVGLWCAHPDQNLSPSIRQAIQLLSFEANFPSLPLAMPVPTYAFMENNHEIGLSSGNSNNTNSSRVTTMSSAGSSSTFMYTS